MARPHKPTAVKTAAGNPGKRALNKQEPDPEYLRDLAAPADLPDGAKAIWREVVPMLARNRLATQADIRILRKLCIAEWQYDMAVERLKGQEGTPLSGNGLSPWEQVRSMNLKACVWFYDRLGMNPRARTQIQVQPQQLLPFGDEENGKPKAAAGEEYFH